MLADAEPSNPPDEYENRDTAATSSPTAKGAVAAQPAATSIAGQPVTGVRRCERRVSTAAVPITAASTNGIATCTVTFADAAPKAADEPPLSRTSGAPTP